MKKLLSLLLALMLLCCTALAETVAVDYSGVWVLTGAEASGIQMGPTLLAASGMTAVMTLNPDGTMTIAMMGIEEAGTWAAAENGITITDETETLAVPCENDILYLEDAGALMMFTREGAAPAIAEAAAPTAMQGVPAQSFEGQWLLTGANMMGMEFSADDLGVYMAFALSGDKGILGTTDDAGNPISSEISWSTEETEAGTLLSLFETNAETGAAETALAVYMLNENTLYMEDSGMAMYFTRQTADAPAQDAAPAAPAQDGSAYIGLWLLTGAEASGIQMSPAILAAAGLEGSLNLCEDGTLSFTFMGATTPGTWVETESGISLTDETGTFELICENEVLSMTDAGALLMFTREGAAPAIPDAVVPVPLTGVPAANFEGQWLLTSASMMGMDFNAADLGLYMAFVFQGGEGLFGATDESGAPTSTPITYILSETETATLLTVCETDAATGKTYELLALVMLDDGRLQYTMEMDGSLISYYFTRQTTE